MPNYASPFIDTQAPAQYATGGGTGAPGPYQSITTGNYSPMNNASSSTYDPNIPMMLAGTIALALITVFVLQQTGFRFVVAAGVGA